MATILVKYHRLPFGELILGSYKNKLCLADWRYRNMRQSIDNRIQQYLGVSYEIGNSDILEETASQLNEFSEGKRTEFNIPLQLCGTSFQQEVWQELLHIPLGKTISYRQLATKLRQPTAIRAIASANGANAISIIIPCHRVIGSNGELIGYAGGIPAKKKLLQLEGSLNSLELFKFSE